MDSVEQILKLEEFFQEKNLLIIVFFNNMIATEKNPKIMELYQYSLSKYLESIEHVAERIESTKSSYDKLKLLLERDLYLNHVIASNGIKSESDEDKNKVVK